MHLLRLLLLFDNVKRKLKRVCLVVYGVYQTISEVKRVGKVVL